MRKFIMFITTVCVLFLINQTEKKSQREIDGVRKQLSRPGTSVINFVVKPLPGLISLAI